MDFMEREIEEKIPVYWIGIRAWTGKQGQKKKEIQKTKQRITDKEVKKGRCPRK